MKPFLFVLTMLCTFFVSAQQKKLDSLINVNEKYVKEDSLKVVYLTNIFRQYARMNNFEKLEEISNKALIIAKKLPQYNSQTYLLERLGLCYHGKAMYVQAISAYTKGIDAAITGNKKQKLAGFYLNLGALYTNINDYPKALENSQLAVNIYNELNDHDQISSCYMNIAVLYKHISQPKKAIDYIQKALLIFSKENAGVNYGAALAYEEMGCIYTDLSVSDLGVLGIKPAEKYQVAMAFLLKALTTAKAAPGCENLLPTIRIEIGKIHEKTGNNSLAILSYEKAFDEIENSNNTEDNALINFTLGKFYSLNNEFKKSISFFEKSIKKAKEIGLLGIQQKSYESLSYVYEKTGRFDSAMLFYKLYINLKDSIYNNEKETEITRKRLQLDFSVKENDYKLTQQITDSKLKQQVLFAKQQQQALQLKQQQLQLANKEKDLQRLTFLKKQLELFNEQQIQAALLQKNSLQAKYEKEVSHKQIAQQQLQILYDGKIKLSLLITLCFAFIVVCLIFYSQRKTARLNSIINNQKNSLEQLGLVKDKIFSVVSHDMRAPVNSLISFIDILDDGKIEQEKLTLYAKELKKNLSYTSTLMNNLLTWAGSQMQGFKSVKEDFNPALLTTEIIHSLQHHLQQKKVTVVNKLSLNNTLNNDRNMFAALLRNLLSNAVKFSYREGVIILTDNCTAEGCKIFVTDNGTGLTEAQLMQFNNDTQIPLESTRGTENEKGTGLGLMLCKSFVQQMNGTIKAYNNYKGITFEIYIPA